MIVGLHHYVRALGRKMDVIGAGGQVAAALAGARSFEDPDHRRDRDVCDTDVRNANRVSSCGLATAVAGPGCNETWGEHKRQPAAATGIHLITLPSSSTALALRPASPTTSIGPALIARPESSGHVR